MTYKVAIIGAGLSGVSLACLIKNDFEVEIFEKSRGVGGRMSTRTNLPYIFDHGAQYFKIDNKHFLDFTSKLIDENVIQPWVYKQAYFEGKNLIKLKKFSKTDRHYVGVPNMDSIVKYLSKDFDIRINTNILKVEKKHKKWNLIDNKNTIYGKYDWVILTLPADQSLVLLSKNLPFYNTIKKIKMRGCFSLMLGITEQLKLDFDAASIKNYDVAWIAVNNSKPARNSGFSLLINSSYEYAEKNMVTPKNQVTDNLLKKTSKLINRNLTHSSLKLLHQWKFVESFNKSKEDYYIDQIQKIAVCGDWCINSRVEDAFISAKKLSKAMKY